MSFQERRLAQIVRDFMDAYDLENEVARRIEGGDLEFASVQSLVGDSEHSALYRLKEETHALFRFDQASSQEELQAEELFDLAVGALFHEAMRFREGYYLTTTYGPRLETMMRAGTASGPLVAAFRKVFEAGRQRMRESAAESRDLFDETRDQLLIVLQHLPQSRLVARSLVENPERTERVFGVPLASLLESIYGSAAAGYRLAVTGMVSSGHFDEAIEWMQRDTVRDAHAFDASSPAFAEGMRAYYAGTPSDALHHLGHWIDATGGQPVEWRGQAERALRSVSSSSDRDVAERAEALVAILRRPLAQHPEPSAPGA